LNVSSLLLRARSRGAPRSARRRGKRPFLLDQLLRLFDRDANDSVLLINPSVTVERLILLLAEPPDVFRRGFDAAGRALQSRFWRYPDSRREWRRRRRLLRLAFIEVVKQSPHQQRHDHHRHGQPDEKFHDAGNVDGVRLVKSFSAVSVVTVGHFVSIIVNNGVAHNLYRKIASATLPHACQFLLTHGRRRDTAPRRVSDGGIP